jgi:hypothetical protein
MFGKRLSEYLGFQRVWLVLTAAVGLARLGLSLAGAPDDSVRFLSMNALLWTGAVYYGVAVHTHGFGSYKQILPLTFLQVLILHVIAVAGIVLGVAGFTNIFAAPEYSGPATAQNQWLHALSHLTIGMVAAPLVLWAVGSLAMWITKKTARRPAVA